MTEAQRRRALDEFTVWLITHPSKRGQRTPVLNCEGAPSFTVITPGAYAYTVGGPDTMRHVADLLGAFTAGDIGRASELMGVPSPSAS